MLYILHFNFLRKYDSKCSFVSLECSLQCSESHLFKVPSDDLRRFNSERFDWLAYLKVTNYNLQRLIIVYCRNKVYK